MTKLPLHMAVLLSSSLGHACEDWLRLPKISWTSLTQAAVAGDPHARYVVSLLEGKAEADGVPVDGDTWRFDNDESGNTTANAIFRRLSAGRLRKERKSLLGRRALDEVFIALPHGYREPQTAYLLRSKRFRAVPRLILVTRGSPLQTAELAEQATLMQATGSFGYLPVHVAARRAFVTGQLVTADLAGTVNSLVGTALMRNLRATEIVFVDQLTYGYRDPETQRRVQAASKELIAAHWREIFENGGAHLWGLEGRKEFTTDGFEVDKAGALNFIARSGRRKTSVTIRSVCFKALKDLR